MRIIDLSHTIETLPDDIPPFMRVDVDLHRPRRGRVEHGAGVRRPAAPAA